MATTKNPTVEELRREIGHERIELTDALDSLRAELDVAPKLPLLAGVAAALGFVIAGGVGATIRLLFRRRREGSEQVRVGRFAVIRRH
jgi:hypothetical protein